MEFLIGFMFLWNKLSFIKMLYDLGKYMVLDGFVWFGLLL